MAEQRGVGRYATFDPSASRGWPAPTGGSAAPTALLDRVGSAGTRLREFYRDPRSWLVLLITSVVFCYGGGLVMFWFHAVQLGEGGPNIGWHEHWLLDSTFAFVGLTPALLLIIPFSAWAAERLAGPRDGWVPWLYVAISGGLFAVVTVPGPVGHDLIVGRGTWVADRATRLFGDPDAPLTPAVEYPLPVALSQQLGAAIPIYLVSAAVALLLVRALLARRARTR